MIWWLLCAGLGGGLFFVAWRAVRLRMRRRSVLPRRSAGRYAARHATDEQHLAPHGARAQPVPLTPVRSLAAVRSPRAVGRGFVSASPRRTAAVVALLAGAVGVLVGGMVAALALAVYGGTLTYWAARRRLVVRADQAHRRQLDELCALAADLRAGLPPPAIVLPTASTGRLARLTRSAVRLAERTGAPLADLVERIEADARAMDRGLAAAEAQAAGARATAALLAGLPLGGIALGYGIGVDPLRILLHTPLGAGCAVGAIVLQLAGLAWAARLSSTGQAERGGGAGQPTTETGRVELFDPVGAPVSAGASTRVWTGLGDGTSPNFGARRARRPGRLPPEPR